MEYPEHEKLKKVSDKSQAIGDFIEWLSYEKKYDLMRRLSENELENFEEDVESVCKETQNFLAFLIREPIVKLLAEFFNISEDKLEEERRAMLESTRKGGE